MDIFRASESTGARILNIDNLKSCKSNAGDYRGWGGWGGYYSSSTLNDANHQGGSANKKGRKKETTLVDHLFFMLYHDEFYMFLSLLSLMPRGSCSF